MPGLHHMIARGHAGSNDPHALENLVAAGQGYEVHVANVDHAGHDVINQGYQSVSNVSHEAATLPEVLITHTNHAVSSIPHSWVTPMMSIRLAGELLPMNTLPLLEGF